MTRFVVYNKKEDQVGILSNELYNVLGIIVRYSVEVNGQMLYYTTDKNVRKYWSVIGIL